MQNFIQICHIYCWIFQFPVNIFHTHTAAHNLWSLNHHNEMKWCSTLSETTVDSKIDIGILSPAFILNWISIINLFFSVYLLNMCMIFKCPAQYVVMKFNIAFELYVCFLFQQQWTVFIEQSLIDYEKKWVAICH